MPLFPAINNSVASGGSSSSGGNGNSGSGRSIGNDGCNCDGTPDSSAGHPIPELSVCVPKTWIRTLNFILVVLSVVVIVKTIQELTSIRSPTDPDLLEDKLRIIGSAVSAVGMLLLPVIWDIVIGYAILTHSPVTIFGFLWPLILIGIDLINSANARGDIPSQRVFGLSDISSDASTILSLTFSVGLLLTSLSGNKAASATVPLLFYALLILAAFILPLPALNPNTTGGFAVASAQRIIINYVLGIIIAALALNVGSTSGVSLREAFYDICGTRVPKLPR